MAALGLRAAWSMPIVSATGKILATFGTYYRERRSPTTQERAVVEFLSQTAAIAIERAQAQQVLQAAEIELRQHAQQLEVKVQERTVRLRDTITELETFSYSVSHDMRAPLRAMQAFARILEEECGEQVSDDGKGYIRRIISASERMDRLIQDMLVYSRLAPANLEMERVDTHALFTGIIQSYPQFHDDAVRIRILNPLPAVKGNETALNQCFANLLNNGIKFARPGIKPEIDVSAETRGDTARITFRDNGVGIDASQWEKIFGLFYRVNRATEGTGIGLAIVKKAMERMNGSVGLTSEPGQGSAFYLELARGDD
ncbi:MAG: GAF domain-containing sensor histidine kinase [Rariglobus sp.]